MGSRNQISVTNCCMFIPSSHLLAFFISGLTYFPQAIQEWEVVNTLAAKYSAFWCQGFTFTFSQLSIGLAHIKIACQTDDSHVINEHMQAFMETLEQANSIFQLEEDNYWIPTITTDCLPKVHSEIESLAKCRVVKKVSARIWVPWIDQENDHSNKWNSHFHWFLQVETPIQSSVLALLLWLQCC